MRSSHHPGQEEGGPTGFVNAPSHSAGHGALSFRNTRTNPYNENPFQGMDWRCGHLFGSKPARFMGLLWYRRSPKA